MYGGGLAALFILSLFLFGCSNGSTEPKKPENSNPIETPQTPNDEQNTEDQTPQNTDEDKNNDDEDIDDDDEDPNKKPCEQGEQETWSGFKEGTTVENGNAYFNVKGAKDIWADEWEEFKEEYPNAKIRLNFIDKEDKTINLTNYFSRANYLRKKIGDDNVVMYLPNDLDEVSQIEFVGGVTETELSEVLAAIKKAITKDENGEATVHTEKLPTFSGIIVPSISENLYENIGGDVDKLIDLYYNSDVFDKFKVSLGEFVFDAKEALNGGSMYKDSNELEANTFNGAYNLDINRALLMNIPLKNVNVNGTINLEDIKAVRAHENIPMKLYSLTNVHFDADLNDIEFVDKSYGIVEFAGLPPRTTPNIAGKVIIHKTGEYDVGIRDLNVLQLGAGVNTLERITPPCGGFAQNIAVGEVYYDGSQVGSIGLGPDAVYHRDSSEDKWGEPVYLKNGYTPKGKNDHYWEQRGNGEVQ